MCVYLRSTLSLEPSPKLSKKSRGAKKEYQHMCYKAADMVNVSGVRDMGGLTNMRGVTNMGGLTIFDGSSGPSGVPFKCDETGRG